VQRKECRGGHERRDSCVYRATVARRHRSLLKYDAARPLRSSSAWRLVPKTPPRENAMPPDDGLLHRVRVALGAGVDVERKRMFGGIAFMVRGKMCQRRSRPNYVPHRPGPPRLRVGTQRLPDSGNERATVPRIRACRCGRSERSNVISTIGLVCG
jgi:hypothetical protein